MLEGYPRGRPDDRTLRMFVEFRQLAISREVRAHLGLTMTEWDDLPVTFQSWAPQFYRLEVERAQRNG